MKTKSVVILLICLFVFSWTRVSLGAAGHTSSSQDLWLCLSRVPGMQDAFAAFAGVEVGEDVSEDILAKAFMLCITEGSISFAEEENKTYIHREDAAMSAVDVSEETLKSIIEVIQEAGLPVRTVQFADEQMESLSPIWEMNVRALYANHLGLTSVSQLGIPSENNLQILDLEDNSIHEFDGLEKAKDLTHLVVSGNGLITVTSLPALEKLVSISCARNSIYEISPLAAFEQLKDIDISDNLVTDISSLAGMELETISLSNNYIGDVSSLDENVVIYGLEDQKGQVFVLQEAEEGPAQIAFTEEEEGPAQIAFTEEEEEPAQIAFTEEEEGPSQISFTEDLEEEDGPEQIAFVEEKTEYQLEVEDALFRCLGKDPIDSDLSMITGLSISDAGLFFAETGLPVDYEPNLQGGTLTAERLKGIIEAAMDYGLSLESISIQNIQVESLSPLKKLKGIKTAYLDGLGLNTLKNVSQLTKLEALYIRDNYIYDLSPIKKLSKLQILYADGNVIKDLTPLSSLDMLSELSFKDNNVVSIAPLEKLSNLKKVYLDGNHIQDFTPVKHVAEVTGMQNQWVKGSLIDHTEVEAESDDYQVLQRGDRGESVRKLQERLIELGYLQDVADGAFGPKTAEAVIAFQTAHGLGSSEVATPQMQRILYSEQAIPKR